MKLQHLATSLMLLGLLVQTSLFFFGLMDPLKRAASLWGKDLEQRRLVVWQPGFVLKSIAAQFPLDARIYLMDPDPTIQYNSVYYFYPRLITITMTNGSYGTTEDYQHWNERPTKEWLAKTNITHVVTFKNGGRIWRITPQTLDQFDAR